MEGAMKRSHDLGEANVQDEVPQSQVEDSAPGLVNDVRQQDDREDSNDQPEEEHDDSGNGKPGYGSRSSSHGRQLPVGVEIMHP
jgi:hypothetical protein